MIKNKALKRRIIEISHKYKLSHLGSCLTAVDIIDEIYATKKPDEKFVLSSGHAGLALYVVLEKYDTPKHLGDGVFDYRALLDAEKIFNHHGVHPDRCDECKIDCSSGSLGQGLPIAVGMALADRSKKVYCLISDGECAEGSIYEAVRIAREQKLHNLHIYLNFNGWGAYGDIEARDVAKFVWPKEILSNNEPHGHMSPANDYSFLFKELSGQDAHYLVMNDEQYKQAMEALA